MMTQYEFSFYFGIIGSVGGLILVAITRFEGRDDLNARRFLTRGYMMIWGSVMFLGGGFIHLSLLEPGKWLTSIYFALGVAILMVNWSVGAFFAGVRIGRFYQWLQGAWAYIRPLFWRFRRRRR